MHRLVLVLFGSMYLCATDLYAQSNEVKALVEEGIRYHDRGAYDTAIAIYKKALQRDSASTLISYELAYSYYANYNYDSALVYCKRTMVPGAMEYFLAAMINGNILQDLNQIKEAIKFYDGLLPIFPNHYLLNYNLAVCYQQEGKLKKSSHYAEIAVLNNIAHTSSNLVLAEVNRDLERRVQSVLPLYFFLLLENNSDRSIYALDMLFKELNEGVDSTKSESVTFGLADFTDPEFLFEPENALINMMAALRYTDTYKDKTEFEWFEDLTEAFFESLGQIEYMRPGAWRDVYIPVFADLAGTEYLETYCYYITQQRYSSSKDWLYENPDAIDKMFAFINRK